MNHMVQTQHLQNWSVKQIQHIYDHMCSINITSIITVTNITVNHNISLQPENTTLIIISSVFVVNFPVNKTLTWQLEKRILVQKASFPQKLF